MGNTNVLAGIACPACGWLGPFTIAVKTLAEVGDDGVGDYESMEWDDESYCACLSCRFDGKVVDFTNAATRENADIPKLEAIRNKLHRLLEACNNLKDPMVRGDMRTAIMIAGGQAVTFANYLRGLRVKKEVTSNGKTA